MKYGLLCYNYGDHFNLGDYIQSIAARQFLPRVDQYLNREKLHVYSGDPTKLIMNGWYMHHPEHWPPSSRIVPLFISFHLNVKHAEQMLTSEGTAYLKSHEPIGCRDLTTVALLKAKNIKAYFSCCLTLTLGNRYHHTEGTEIYLVDVLYKYPTVKSVFQSFNRFRKSVKNGNLFLLGQRKKLLRAVLGDSLVESAKEITHHYPAKSFPTEESRFALAEDTLKRYEKAGLVITSRIHCALPCLAMGTPVIFIEGRLQNPSEQCRLDSIRPLFHTVKISQNGDYTADFELESVRNGKIPQNKTLHLKYLEKLNRCCNTFIYDTP